MNNDSKPVSRKNDGDNEVHKFGGNDVEHAKKAGKSKGQKMSKSRKSAKLGKNSSKSGNSPNFGATKTGLSFLTLGARETLNCLHLTFTEALILRHFDPKCHIWIETDALGYVIGGVLS